MQIWRDLVARYYIFVQTWLVICNIPSSACSSLRLPFFLWKSKWWKERISRSPVSWRQFLQHRPHTISAYEWRLQAAHVSPLWSATTSIRIFFSCDNPHCGNETSQDHQLPKLARYIKPNSPKNTTQWPGTEHLGSSSHLVLVCQQLISDFCDSSSF